MHEALIEQMLALEITPMELFYSEVRDVVSSARTKAYKTDVLVRSIPLGDLSAAQYQPTANRSNQCIALAMWALTNACREITALVEAEQDMDWYSVHIPLKFIERADMEATLRSIFEAEEFKHAAKLMLEFPPEAVYLDAEVLSAAVNGAKNVGVRCLLTGVGSENYPVIRLASLPLEMVQTHESVAESFRDDERAVTAAALVTYLRSLSLKVLVAGVDADEDAIIAGLERLGCFGIITPQPKRYNLQFMLDEIARERGEMLEEAMQSYGKLAAEATGEVAGEAAEAADAADAPEQAPEEEVDLIEQIHRVFADVELPPSRDIPPLQPPESTAVVEMNRPL